MLRRGRHTTFSADRTDPDTRAWYDVAAIDTFGSAVTESGRPLVVTSGTLVMPTGQISAETNTPDWDSIAAHRIPGDRPGATQGSPLDGFTILA
jgi:hypothetical protein